MQAIASPGEAFDRLAQGAGSSIQQAVGEQRHVHRPLAQGRHVQRDGRQPVVEVLAEAAAAHISLPGRGWWPR